LLPIFSLSNCMFSTLLEDEVAVIPIIGTVIGFLHSALPMK